MKTMSDPPKELHVRFGLNALSDFLSWAREFVASPCSVSHRLSFHDKDIFGFSVNDLGSACDANVDDALLRKSDETYFYHQR